MSMDEQMRGIVEFIKTDMLKNLPHMRMLENVVPVSGTRHTIPLEGRELGIVYYEADIPNAPLILGFHGGGFLFGGASLDDAMWCAVAKKLGANVVSVGYRMTPDFMWPAPIEDAYDTAVYMKAHAAEYGFDQTRISVMGCSAGANIAAAVSMYAKDHGNVAFDYQILVYPEVDCVTDPAAKPKGSLDIPMFYVFNELYVRPEDAAHKYCSPIMATEDDVKQLPIAIICLAENDALMPEGKAYGEKLAAAGNTVYADIPEPDMPHGYFEYGFGGAEGQDFLSDTVKAQISDGSIGRCAAHSLEFIYAHFYK